MSAGNPDRKLHVYVVVSSLNVEYGCGSGLSAPAHSLWPSPLSQQPLLSFQLLAALLTQQPCLSTINNRSGAFRESANRALVIVF